MIGPSLAALLLASTAGAQYTQAGQTWGFIDRTGRLVIDTKYDSAGSFSEGLASVKLGKRHLFIDRSGRTRIVLDSAIIDVLSFHGGLAAARYAKRDWTVTYLWGYIDKTGAWAIPPQFDVAFSFSDGRALVNYDTYIDLEGKPIALPGDARPAGSYSEGLAAFRSKPGGDVGYMDLEGNVVIKPQFYDGRPFTRGRALVFKNKRDEDGFWIDRTGKRIPTPKGTKSPLGRQSLPGDNGLVRGGVSSRFYDYEGNEALEGNVQENGEWVTKFHEAGAFSEGLASAQRRGHRFEGYIDTTGTWVIEPKWDYAGEFRDGLAVVQTGLAEIMQAGREAAQRNFTRLVAEAEAEAARARVASVPAKARLADGRVRFVYYEAYAAMKATSDGIRSYYIRYAVVTAPANATEAAIIAAVPMDKKPPVQPLTVLASRGVYPDTSGVPGVDLPQQLGLYNPNPRIFKSMYTINIQQFGDVSIPR